MIKPVRCGEELLADIQAAEAVGGCAVWWLGQSGFLVKIAGRCLLFDPYLSDSLTRKYADTDKPHVRMTALAVDPGRLTGIDAVTSSHLHTDHLDAETLVPLRAANPKLQMVIPEANRTLVAERLRCDARWPIGLNEDESAMVADFEVHGIAAAHDSVDRDESGRCRYLGYVVRRGGFTIYHSGDTLWHDGLDAQLAPFAIDLALLPINGRLPTRRVAGNLWGQEAAALAHTIGARVVVPCHYEMFTLNTESPDAFAAKCRELDQPYCLLRCGQRLTLESAGGGFSVT